MLYQRSGRRWIRKSAALANMLMIVSVCCAGATTESLKASGSVPAAPTQQPGNASSATPGLASAGALRFAQISDVHLFDAGYKCSGLYVEREYEENLNALRWSVDEVNRRWKSGDKVNFIVFTGDMGITNLVGTPAVNPAPDSNSNCSDPNDPASSYGPIAQKDFATAETIVANILDYLPADIKVYFLPGNNDLTDEDPQTLGRYEQFVAGLRTLTHGRVTDLNGHAIQERGYTLVGLNSAGFKPQSYKDSQSGTVDESLIVSPGKVRDDKYSYCDELKDGSSGSRADAKANAITTYSALVNGPGPYLVFTHEPDLQDPFAGRRLAAKASGGRCEFRSTWLLTDSARKAWMAGGLDNPKVVGIFAGHFHADNPAVYGGPNTNASVAAIYKEDCGGKDPTRSGGLAPIYVTPRLAVKLQWANYPNGARGMMFVSVDDGTVRAQIDPYWTSLASDCCENAHAKLVTAILGRLKKYPRETFLWALLFTNILVVIVLLLAGELDPRCVPYTQRKLWIHRWSRNRLSCIRYTALKLMIDGETQTYSLSKMQFLLWTLATIYAYIYLLLAHTWVQSLPGLPDIADQFPWEISLSAGTALAAQVSQRTLGTKGGGPLQPRLSDLISAGGVVSPGRLQFFSWTLVAIGAYLSSVLASDPCTAHMLPSIPQNVLVVSGLSSLAYLGTRAVSAPGPVISAATFKPDAGGDLAAQPVGTPVAPPPAPPAAPAAPPAGLTNGTLTLLGSGLSKTAVVVMVADPTGGVGSAIGGTAASVPASVGGNSNPPQLDMTKSDVQIQPPPYPVDPSFAVPGNPDFSTRLDVTVRDLDLTKTYRIRVTNPDGKFGEGELPAS